VLLPVGAYALQPLLRALIELPFAVRVLVSVVLLAPLGLVLGTAMPTGLTRLAGLHPGAVPWAWAVNGAASVLASVAAVAIAITWGFSAVMLAATACYLVALADVRLSPWPRDQAIAGASGSRASAASMSASENSGSSSVPERNAS
jgi:hypothetical protein